MIDAMLESPATAALMEGAYSLSRGTQGRRKGGHQAKGREGEGAAAAADDDDDDNGGEEEDCDAYGC